MVVHHLRIPLRVQHAIHVLGLGLRGKVEGFGHAAVCYGDPVSLRDFALTHPDSTTGQLAETLMQGIRDAVPILPVALAAAAVEQAQAVGATDRESLIVQAHALAARGADKGAFLLKPPAQAEAMLNEGLAQMVLRGIVTRNGDAISVPDAQRQALAYYAASASQRLAEGADRPGGARLLGPPEGYSAQGGT